MNPDGTFPEKPYEPEIAILPHKPEPCEVCPPEPVPEIVICPPEPKPLPEIIVEPGCPLTKDDCPNRNFSVDKVRCECVCRDLICIATTTPNMNTCTCDPILIPDKPLRPILPIIVEPPPAPVLSKKERRRLRRERRRKRRSWRFRTANTGTDEYQFA